MLTSVPVLPLPERSAVVLVSELAGGTVEEPVADEFLGERRIRPRGRMRRIGRAEIV